MITALLASAYLGWSLGANDAANIFGTAVSSKMLRFITAAILASVFVMLGATTAGYEGMETLSNLAAPSAEAAAISAFAAAVTVTAMTLLKLPVSTSQAVVGAIIGVGILQHHVNFSGLTKVVICWVGTPVGAFLVAVLLYFPLCKIHNRAKLGILWEDGALRAGLVVAGCYGAYALGANNVANVTGSLVGAKLLGPFEAAVIGGLSISAGILTFSKGVMGTVGKGIIKLDAFSALVVLLAEAVTVHVYAIVGVPVSTSQAVVGAVLGIGVLKRIEAIKGRAVFGVFSGWIATPFLAVAIAMATYFLLHLEFRYTG